MPDELKPCPNCGDKTPVEKPGEIRCALCSLAVRNFSVKKFQYTHIENWNSLPRHQGSEELRAEVARLREAAQELEEFAVECANDRDDRVSPGIKAQAQIALEAYRKERGL